jgi:hypothetical protein
MDKISEVDLLEIAKADKTPTQVMNPSLIANAAYSLSSLARMCAFIIIQACP